MSDRNYINNVEIFDYVPKYYEELQRQGCDIDEECHFGGFEVKEFMPLLLAFDQDIKNYFKKRLDEWKFFEDALKKNTKADEDTRRRIDIDYNPHFFDFRREMSSSRLNMFLDEYIEENHYITHWVEQGEGTIESLKDMWGGRSPSTLTTIMSLMDRIEFATYNFFKACEPCLEQTGQFEWKIKDGCSLIACRY